MFRNALGGWLWAILFVQALLFLRLVRHGQPVPLSAAIAGVFALTSYFLVLAMRRGPNLRRWTGQQRKELLLGMGVALCAGLLLCVAQWLWPVGS